MSEWRETELGLIPIDWTVGYFQKDVVVKGRIGWKGYKTSDLVEKGPFVIGGTEIKNSIFLDLTDAKCLSHEKYDESPEIILKEGDVILVTRGNGLADIGFFHHEYGEATINPSVIILQSKKINSKFLFYYLLSKQGRYQVLSLESGSSIPAIYQADVRKLSYPKPPEKEIEGIVKTIFTIDQKITLLRQQNHDLEELAQTLFKRWFVEFEFPNENGEPYKSSGGKMVESELGEIPEGWRVGCLGDEFTILMGQSPDGSSYNEKKEGVIFYQGRTDFGFRFPTNRLYTTEPKRMAKKLDVLISVRAPVGDINMASEECCIGRGLGAVKSDLKSYCFNKVKSFKKAFDVFENEGTVFGSMSKNDFNSLEAIIPEKKIAEKYDKVALKLDLKIFENTTEIQTLTQLRDTLLPKLMCGELRVKN